MTDDNTLYYMRQRYYNPQIKRFINQNILTGSIGNSASLNRYSYVEGNPVSYTDPFGLSPFSYMSESLHKTLDWFGMIPFVGVGFDLVNAAIYLMEGEPTYALFAALSSVGPADGIKFIIKNGKKSIIGITLTGIFCQTDAGAGLKQDLTGLGQDYITYYGYDQMSNTELALSLTIDIFFGAKSGYDDLNIKKKKVDVDLDDFVPDNATSRLDKIDGDDLVPDNTSAVINRADVDNVVANTQGFGGCFVEGTEIKTIEGDKNIEDIHAGDMVYSKNTETGEEGYKEVVRVFKKKTYELVYLTIGDEEIITTPNHPFYVVDEGFVEAGNLQIGDKVETADGEILEIEAITIEYLDEPIQIYNFEVADWHTYYVSEEEVLVHNNCAVSVPSKPNTVRRFMTKKEYKEFKKQGFQYVPSDPRGGISSTSTSIKPNNPDKIKRSTGALGADYYVDINVKDKKVFLKGKTKGGVLDWKIQEDVHVSDIVNSGRVKK